MTGSAGGMTAILRRLAIAAAIACAASPAGGPAHGATPPEFRASIVPLSPAERSAMTPSTWRPGCPVGLARLRMVQVSRWDFNGHVRTGRVVVNRDVARAVVEAFRRLYEARFPIRWMTPVERFGGSDFRSIEADNTSAFNCRYVDGTRRWSSHAFGRAIDINPIENPYVTASGQTSHRASLPYVRRTPHRPGMLFAGGPGVAAFLAVGWGWGGSWIGARDYQHVSASGR